MSDLFHTDAMLAILMMAVVTAALRTGGFFLMSYVTVTPRVRRMLDSLPGCVIAAAVLPVAMRGGLVAVAAVLSALLAMYLSRSITLAIVCGVGIAALMRAYGISG